MLATLLVLKREREGAMSQEIWAALTSCERQETDLTLEPSKGNAALFTKLILL